MYIHSADPTASTVGGLAVGVPGEMRGWEQLHNRHGMLPWKRLFESAIHVSRNGFEVNVDLANFLSIGSHPVRPKGALLLMRCRQVLILEDPLWAEVYAPNGTLARRYLLPQGSSLGRVYDVKLIPVQEICRHLGKVGNFFMLRVIIHQIWHTGRLSHHGANYFYHGGIANNTAAGAWQTLRDAI